MDNEEQEIVGGPEPEKAQQQLVRLIKSIVEDPTRGTSIDDTVVKQEFFNAFNYSLLSGEGKDINVAIGITSANRGEGKTLVACNLAVSLAMGYQKKTVLVDLNFSKPRIHGIFGLPNGPGLADAFTNGSIHVAQTAVDHLYVLSTGVIPLFHDARMTGNERTAGPARITPKPLVSLEQLSGFRDVIYSLQQEFDFVIVDMPAIQSGEVPIVFASQLSGVLVVVNTGKTKTGDIDAMFQKLNQQQVLGFIFNRAGESAY